MPSVRENGGGADGGVRAGGGSVELESLLEKLVPGRSQAWEERACVLRRAGVRGGASLDYYKDFKTMATGRIRGHMDLYASSQVMV